MGEPYLILIADRNRHVRDLLRRELAAEGYRVKVAKDDGEVLESIGRKDEEGPALVVLDLEIPYAGSLELVEKLRELRPDLPVVIHTVYADLDRHAALRNTAAFVEKKGDINGLKLKIRQVLEEYYASGNPGNASDRGSDSSENAG